MQIRVTGPSGCLKAGAVPSYQWFLVPGNNREMMSDPPGWRICKRFDKHGDKYYVLYEEFSGEVKPHSTHIDYNALMERADRAKEKAVSSASG